MILTKQTIFIFVDSEPETYDLDACEAAVNAKINELVAQGKTDGLHNYTYPEPGQMKVQRDWIDQAAAEEWTTFVINLSADLGREIISNSIIDIP